MKFLINTLMSAIIIAVFTEISKRSTFMAALLISLPINSLLALTLVNFESGDQSKIIELSYGIFWLVLPSLGIFLVLPFLLKQGFNFSVALLTSCAGLSIFYVIYSKILISFGLIK